MFLRDLCSAKWYLFSLSLRILCWIGALVYRIFRAYGVILGWEQSDVALHASSLPRTWQSAPDTMVGFVPRIHGVDKSKGDQGTYIYSGWWSVWWTGTYSMILSKAAFFHKKYLNMYTYEMSSSIREYVTKNRNCEDISMSFLVANATLALPIWVKDSLCHIT